MLFVLLMFEIAVLVEMNSEQGSERKPRLSHALARMARRSVGSKGSCSAWLNALSYKSSIPTS